ncbi:MAG: hypothetical protein EOO13_05355 [Chitinophagaceae bacterium]|nr:MAG: hypothetical protein EOO13_05355 [Chitinophagaceae bacterium]
MKAINLKSALAVLCFAALTMVSCKKNNDDILLQAEPVTIEGYWVGKSGTIITPPTAYFSLNIIKGGLLEVLKQDKTVLGKGTWKLDGQTFTAVYKYDGTAIKYNLAAKYDAAKKSLSGSWGDGEVVADNGEFFLDKQ